MEQFRQFVENSVFGVCSRIGEKLGVPATTIRKYFIYVSCLTAGSPIIVYMFLAFWINLKNYIWRARRNPLKYL